MIDRDYTHLYKQPAESVPMLPPFPIAPVVPYLPPALPTYPHTSDQRVDLEKFFAPVITKANIAIVLDSSGSMSGVKDVTVNNVNEQIDTIRSKAAAVGQTNVSLVTFNSDVYVKFFAKPYTQCEHISPADYSPHGSTSLYDAIGYTVERLKRETDPNDKNTTYLIVIATDGQENSSVFYNQPRIASLISELQETGRWTFLYVGCNQDVMKVQQQLHIPISNMASHSGTRSGHHEASVKTCGGIDMYMANLSKGVASSRNLMSEDDTKCAVVEDAPVEDDHKSDNKS